LRYGARVAPPGPLSGCDFAVVQLKTDRWREFWLVSKLAAPDSWTLDLYQSEADAIAGVRKLAAGAHGPSGAGVIDVAMVPEVGALFSVAGMVAQVRANGATPDIRVAWTHNLLGLLIARVVALLAQYRDPYEMLERTNPIVGHQVPIALLPAIGVSSGSVTLEGQVQQFDEHDVQLELHAWVSRLDNENAYLDAVRLGSALISIAEEQRTWGGLAADTQVLGPAMIGEERPEGGGLLYHALVVCRVRFPDMVGSRSAAGEYGDGGVYAESLT